MWGSENMFFVIALGLCFGIHGVEASLLFSVFKWPFKSECSFEPSFTVEVLRAGNTVF